MNELPVGGNPAPLSFLHFPAPFQAVIFRNWGQITPAKLAYVLGANEEVILREAARMGLRVPADAKDEELWTRRGYLTLIRQNWHLLPYEQLLDLLGWTPRKMLFVLKEEDSLWGKLGCLKPACEHVTFSALDGGAENATNLLARSVGLRETMIAGVQVRETPFQFLQNYQTRRSVGPLQKAAAGFPPRIAYSFFASFGDALLDAALDPYPDRLLEEYAACGVNAVWLTGLLYTLVPWLGPTRHSEGHETRIENLNRLVERARKFGIGIYLYLNEPRNMPTPFFEKHPDWQGKKMERTSCLCPSSEEVLERLEAGTRDLAVKVPDLAGTFTITMSENPTHCKANPWHRWEECSRCAGRPAQDFVVEVNNVIARGLLAGNPSLRVAAWDWGWDPEWNPAFIAQLDPRIVLMCTSEAFVRTEAMGVEGWVGDYSIAHPGPGPVALKHWAAARSHGREIWAKVQINNTWECSAVPYLPVPFLVREHLDRIRTEGVSGLMVSWTLGGYPGGNMPLLHETPESLAEERFGPGLAPDVLEAWKQFGEAFGEFPIHGAGALYHAPQNYGPMNLLFEKPTGYTSTMVGFPYDDLHAWRTGGHYPEEVFEEQFRKLSEGWKRGITTLENARNKLSGTPHAQLDNLIGIATAAWCHFRSVHLQIRFVRLRGSSDDTSREEVASILHEEIDLASRLLLLSVADSRIGFEASNHYYYTRQSLLEKILNCEDLLRSRLSAADGVS